MWHATSSLAEREENGEEPCKGQYLSDHQCWACSFPAPRMTPAQHTTTDRYLASFLCFRGAVLLSHRRLGPKKVEFSFRADQQLHDLLRLYWSGQLTPVIPADLFACLHRLKCLSIIHP